MQFSLHSLGRLVALAAVLFVTACSSTPNTNHSAVASNSDANAVALAQADEEDPLICKTVIPSGTRIGRKVCIRKSERDRIREQSQTITIENQRRSVIGNPVGN